MDERMIKINDHLSIDEREISFTYTQSPAPGGQNVNKVATKATLRFDVRNSASLTPQMKSRIQSKLATRISKDGILRVASWRERSQRANRRDALVRFTGLIAEAIRVRPPRKKKKVSKAAIARRLEAKRRRSRLKQTRRRPTRDD